jgi:hypothetical protein
VGQEQHHFIQTQFSQAAEVTLDTAE